MHRVPLGSGIDVGGVFSYEGARAALTHPALLHDVTPAEALPAGAGTTSHKVGVGLGGSMLQLDPPDHTRLRRLVAPAFSPRRTQLLARRVQEITDGLLDALTGRSEVDLVESFTAPC
ncbi:hypothetical protein GCM10022223_63340 [Kineosporia mesophila]|uniref:Cytochrome P450 n=1 Tax=Kineosporia mesophila TaxID=566012 RepID=A0ABP7ANK3_9ACTN